MSNDKHIKPAKCDFCEKAAAIRFKLCGDHGKIIFKLLMKGCLEERKPNERA